MALVRSKYVLLPAAVAALLAAVTTFAGEPAGGSGKAAPASKWTKDHTGLIPFIIGFDKGKKEAEFTGKPMFVFFTATW
ncbi:MAG: hypothetical protein L0Z55_13185 [Planctomycetes bacterium]|nr:hypothetical protein [Planctomycetota bacterium]